MNQLTTKELNEIARQAMIENGFETGFPPNVIESVNNLKENVTDFLKDPSIRDLRSLLWSSIDDASSRDLDQIEYVEELPNGDIRVLIGIADVDEFVPKGSAVDIHAAKNTISIYAGSHVFPMLPEELSTDLTSLLNDVDRLAIVIEMVVAKDGTIGSKDIFRAVLHNYAKLSYEEIGAWLDENTPVPNSVSEVAGMQEQILLQFKVAKRLLEFRQNHGALEFETIEASPVITDGNITNIKILHSNSARKIIENFMISANVTMAEFLEKHNFISLRRVVKTPARWDRIVEVAASFGTKLPEIADSLALADFLNARKTADPLHFPDLSLSIVKLLGPGEYTVQLPNEEIDGHFGLAVRDYSHSTAPNRRYADIVTQRLVKSILNKSPVPYQADELTAIAKCCNERAAAARKVERQTRKAIAASILSSRIGEEFDAIVTGVKPNIGTFARLLNPPADGRIVRGEQGLEVGEKIRVKLIDTDPHRGFIDFAYQH
jgi:VacB/RNase II family 3'-5' exoribonuclease